MTRRKTFPTLSTVAFAAAVVLPLVPLSRAAADDWPQWLGPRRDGTATGLVAAGGPIKLRKLWQRPVEKAWSGLAVVGDRAYTLEAQDGADVAVALDVATGHELWRTRIDAGDPGAVEETGPGSTPAVAGGRVFALGTACRLVALDAASGKLLWQHQLREELGTGPHRVGCQTSPLLADDRLIVQASGATENRLVAYEPATGKLLWTSKGVDRTSSSSPVLAEIGGERQIVVHYADSTVQPQASGLYGASLTDGTVRWQVRLDQGNSVDTPLLLPNGRIVLQTWSDVRLFQVTKDGDSFRAAQVWASESLRAASGPPVHHDGHLYGFGRDFLACLDAATGKTVWTEKLYAGSVALADGHLVALGHASGQLHVAEATPAGYREKTRLEVFAPGPSGDTPPSLAGRRIFLRNNAEIVAVEVGG